MSASHGRISQSAAMMALSVTRSRCGGGIEQDVIEPVANGAQGPLKNGVSERLVCKRLVVEAHVSGDDEEPQNRALADNLDEPLLLDGLGNREACLPGAGRQPRLRAGLAGRGPSREPSSPRLAKPEARLMAVWSSRTLPSGW